MSSEDPSTFVEYRREGQIAVISLNRPERLNAFSDAMVSALSDALHRFDLDPETNVAVLHGNGRAFSSGADVRQRQMKPREELEASGGPQGRGSHSADLFTRCVNWKPVITAVHGYVLGLAVGIMLESDLIVAAAGTRLQITETSRGLGASRYWGLLNQRGAAAFGNDIALTGRFFTAEEAREAGLINRLAPEGEHVEVAMELARQVNANPPLSVRATVRTRRWYMDQLSREIMMQNAPLKLYLTEDFREAARAFLEKRPAGPFKGR